MTETSESAHGPIRRLLGLVLIVAGVLWMVAVGLCSGAFFVSILVEGVYFREAIVILPILVFVGGLGAGTGLMITIIGRMLRPKR